MYNAQDYHEVTLRDGNVGVKYKERSCPHATELWKYNTVSLSGDIDGGPPYQTADRTRCWSLSCLQMLVIVYVLTSYVYFYYFKKYYSVLSKYASSTKEYRKYPQSFEFEVKKWNHVHISYIVR